MSAAAPDAWPARPGWRDSAARILPLAWPVFIAQLAVIAFGTLDTLLVARYAALDLAALAVGSAAYITVFIGFMGVVVAAGPIVGQFFGARKLPEAGHQLHQAVWLALGLSVLGCLLLAFPRPFMALSQAAPEVETKVRQYLGALAFALPAALLFAAYRGFNNAVSRPKAVMVIQLGGLALKLPLSAALVFGVPALGIPELGVMGCGIATAIAMWAQVAAGLWVLKRDRFYAPFALGKRLRPPDRKALGAQLRLGVPMGMSILIEVTGFAFMAIFIVRLGATPVAGHQLAANMVSVLFMLPLALGNATGTLVAQRIGARDLAAARRIGWHGLQIGVCLAGRAAPGLARPANGRGAGCAARRAGLRVAPRRGAAVHRRCRSHRRGAAAAGLGSAVPHRRRGAMRGVVRAARLPHRDIADADLPGVAVGRGPGRRLCAGLRRHWAHAAAAARRTRLLDRLHRRSGPGRAGARRLAGAGAAAAIAARRRIRRLKRQALATRSRGARDREPAPFDLACGRISAMRAHGA